MALLETKRYFPKSPLLKTLIKYFWVFETEGSVNLNHKILPVTNIDLIFNFYDQPHFIREFKSFTGSSPTRFVKEKQAIMQITKIV